MIEPVFADTKFNRRADRFLRRGRAAARSEWRLITATENLLKLWRHTTPPRRPDKDRRRAAAQLPRETTPTPALAGRSRPFATASMHLSSRDHGRPATGRAIAIA